MKQKPRSTKPFSEVLSEQVEKANSEGVQPISQQDCHAELRVRGADPNSAYSGFGILAFPALPAIGDSLLLKSKRVRGAVHVVQRYIPEGGTTPIILGVCRLVESVPPPGEEEFSVIMKSYESFGHNAPAEINPTEA